MKIGLGVPGAMQDAVLEEIIVCSCDICYHINVTTQEANI